MTYARNKVLENDEPIPAFDYQDLRGYEMVMYLDINRRDFFKMKRISEIVQHKVLVQ